jgi:methyl-accepting chemotaxis protein
VPCLRTDAERVLESEDSVKLKMNIRNKFLIPTILLIIIGSGFVSVISYVKSQNALKEAVLDNIQQRTESTARTLQTWIKDRTLDLTSWCHEEVYAKAVKDDVVGKAARAAANEKMSRLKADFGYYEDISLADASGLIIASSAESIIGKIKVADRSYFKAAMAGKVFVSEVAKSRNTGNTVFLSPHRLRKSRRLPASSPVWSVSAAFPAFLSTPSKSAKAVMPTCTIRTV